jgi:hypothetical protein
MGRTLQSPILTVATLLGVSIILCCNDSSIDTGEKGSLPVISVTYVEASIPPCEYGGKNPFPIHQQQKGSNSLSKTTFKSLCDNLFLTGMRRKSRAYQGRPPPKIFPLGFETEDSLRKHFRTELPPGKSNSPVDNDQSGRSPTLLHSPCRLIRRVSNLVSLKFLCRREHDFTGTHGQETEAKRPGKGEHNALAEQRCQGPIFFNRL